MSALTMQYSYSWVLLLLSSPIFIIIIIIIIIIFQIKKPFLPQLVSDSLPLAGGAWHDIPTILVTSSWRLPGPFHVVSPTTVTMTFRVCQQIHKVAITFHGSGSQKRHVKLSVRVLLKGVLNTTTQLTSQWKQKARQPSRNPVLHLASLLLIISLVSYRFLSRCTLYLVILDKYFFLSTSWARETIV